MVTFETNFGGAEALTYVTVPEIEPFGDAVGVAVAVLVAVLVGVIVGVFVGVLVAVAVGDPAG